MDGWMDGWYMDVTLHLNPIRSNPSHIYSIFFVFLLLRDESLSPSNPSTTTNTPS